MVGTQYFVVEQRCERQCSSTELDLRRLLTSLLDCWWPAFACRWVAASQGNLPDSDSLEFGRCSLVLVLEWWATVAWRSEVRDMQIRFFGLLLGVFTLTLISACQVPDPKLPELPVPDGARSGLIVLVHGSGDSPADWPAEMEQAVAAQLAEPSTWDLWAYDWEEDAAQRLVAAELGLLHGFYLGETLLENGIYRQVHLIGHSVGAFVVHGVEQWLSQSDAAELLLHSTYLDPFGGRGSDWDFGELHFGESASFAEAYFNRDDPAPSTNGALQQAHNFDVTEAKPDGLSGRDGHWWPVQFYTDSVATDTAGIALSSAVNQLALEDLHESWPRGQETSLP